MAGLDYTSAASVLAGTPSSRREPTTGRRPVPEANIARWANLPDITGQRFGRLVVLGRAATPFGKLGRYWLARCECGVERLMAGRRMLSGLTQSCGCLADERRRAPRKHGLSHRNARSQEYAIWMGIKDRCENLTSKHSKHYGQRGISLCERWQAFENFLSDMGSRPSSRHSVDRIDPNGNYEPSNCRWATQKEQGRNKRDTKLTEVSVCLIRHMAKRGARLVDIAWAFDVSKTHISKIVSRQKWLAEGEVQP